MTPLNPKNPDELTFAGSDADAKALAHATGIDDDLARSGKLVFPGTSLGAKCDLEGIKIDTDPTPLERLPNSPRAPGVSAHIDDGTRIDSAGLSRNPEQSLDYGS